MIRISTVVLAMVLSVASVVACQPTTTGTGRRANTQPAETVRVPLPSILLYEEDGTGREMVEVRSLEDERVLVLNEESPTDGSYWRIVWGGNGALVQYRLDEEGATILEMQLVNTMTLTEHHFTPQGDSDLAIGLVAQAAESPLLLYQQDKDGTYIILPYDVATDTFYDPIPFGTMLPSYAAWNADGTHVILHSYAGDGDTNQLYSWTVGEKDVPHVYAPADGTLLLAGLYEVSTLSPDGRYYLFAEVGSADIEGAETVPLQLLDTTTGNLTILTDIPMGNPFEVVEWISPTQAVLTGSTWGFKDGLILVDVAEAHAEVLMESGYMGTMYFENAVDAKGLTIIISASEPPMDSDFSNDPEGSDHFYRFDLATGTADMEWTFDSYDGRIYFSKGLGLYYTLNDSDELVFFTGDGTIQHRLPCSALLCIGRVSISPDGKWVSAPTPLAEGEGVTEETEVTTYTLYSTDTWLPTGEVTHAFNPHLNGYWLPDGSGYYVKEYSFELEAYYVNSSPNPDLIYHVSWDGAQWQENEVYRLTDPTATEGLYLAFPLSN
jgi:hypothetical protein